MNHRGTDVPARRGLESLPHYCAGCGEVGFVLHSAARWWVSMATVPVRAPSSRQAGHRYYLGAGFLALAIVLTGFSRTYFLRGYFQSSALLPIIHLHAVVFTSWVALFITQAWLVSARRTRVHMKLGIAGFVLAAAMIAIGTTAAIWVARLGHVRPSGLNPLVFLAVPLFDMVVFAMLMTAGFVMRFRADYHKRIMLVATASLMTAAFGRMIIMVQGRGNVNLAFLCTDLLVVLAAAVDGVLNRRLHPAFVWAGALVLVSHPLRFAIASTDAWMSFARWVTG